MAINIFRDVESEKGILESLFLEPNLINTIDITTSDFTHPEYVLIYEAMLKLHADGEVEKFESKPIIDINPKISEATIFRITDSAVTAANIGYHVKRVKKAAFNRTSRNLITQLQKKIGEEDFQKEVVQFNEFVTKNYDSHGRQKRNLAKEVLTLMNLTKGYISLTEIYNTLQIFTKEEKNNIYVIMNRLIKEGIIERFGNKNGQFRKIDNAIENINWYDADEKAHLPILYPFNLHEYVLTLPKNIVIIAGSKDAGKTCFLLNTACLNRAGNLKIYYFSSEMGEVEMKKRLVKMSNQLHIPLEEMRDKIHWIDRSGDFPDIIFPEALNIIDFLEITKDFFEVGDMVKNIYHKLTTGIAIIAIQKPANRDMPIGGEKGLEKARIALAINNHRAKILVGKNWAADINPRGFECRFQIIQGSEMRMTEPWDKI